jgi:hypothetical protein
MDKTVQYLQIVICCLQDALSLFLERVEVLLPFFGQIFDGFLREDDVFLRLFCFFHATPLQLRMIEARPSRSYYLRKTLTRRTGGHGQPAVQPVKTSMPRN